MGKARRGWKGAGRARKGWKNVKGWRLGGTVVLGWKRAGIGYLRLERTVSYWEGDGKGWQRLGRARKS